MTNRIYPPRIGRYAPALFFVSAVLTAPVLADAAAKKVLDGTNMESAAATQTETLPKPPAASSVPSRAELVKLIDRMAAKYGLDSSLVHAIVRAESNYNPHAVSHAGAVGLMQVMPATAADYGVSSTDKLFDPTINAQTGTRHLKRLLGKYSIGKAVMAYNAGEGALERSKGFVTFAETQVYTHRVLTSYLRGKGVEPYSPEAQKLTGIQLTPAMARARATPSSSIQAVNRQVSRLRLRLEPTWVTSPLSKNALDPRLHQTGPKSKPMFVLEPPKVRPRP
ncbi:Membrane-bound lytic murein transglycosylase C precursor [Thiorhodovibrio winogradskyi]|uniref:Membrane-bound lytic murein transglycosylase C n=1 Tax=Thiorhodovibrio winogradskyi TaxID=77007 RepID=A0ABZ0SDU4_9GAMM|nr:lytic transglycosylase domain-containing protein [Thiorhodovibrio winogradskyi]